MQDDAPDRRSRQAHKQIINPIPYTPGAPENTNQMGGAWPILVCSTLTSPLLTVPRKGSLWMSGATELASLHSHNEWEACRQALQDCHACMPA